MAADERLIPFNPVRRRRRRGRRSRRAVPERIWATPEQAVRIAEQAGVLGGPIARLLIITVAWTGCRWGELAGLHRDNIDLRRGLLVIDPLVGALHESGSMRWLGPPKTRASARTIALPPFLIALLREHLAQHRYEFVFTTPSGTWLWRSTFLRRVFRAAVDGSDASGTKAGCEAVRLGLTFYGLRHSHKTWLIAGGAPEIAQARRLGHHLDNRVIETYSHVAPEVEQRLLDDLERRWHTAAPPPPTPSPSVVDSRRVAPVVPLFATAGVTRRPRPRPAGTPRRRRNGAGAVLQFCPTRSTTSRRKSITEDRTGNAENPSDQPSVRGSSNAASPCATPKDAHAPRRPPRQVRLNDQVHRRVVDPTRSGHRTRRASRHRDHGCRRRPHLPLRLRQRPQPGDQAGRTRMGRTAGRPRGRPVHPRPAARYPTPRPARRHTGATPASPPTTHLRQPRNLALNIADPLITGTYGKAAFDAVGPLLLIGWAEVGPGLLQAISAIGQLKETTDANERSTAPDTDVTINNTHRANTVPTAMTMTGSGAGSASNTASGPATIAPDDLIDRARHEDYRHWTEYQRPISAETLRKNLHISTARSRMLVSIIRAERSGDRTAHVAAVGHATSE